MGVDKVTDKQFFVLQNVFGVKDANKDKAISLDPLKKEGGEKIAAADSDPNGQISDIELANYYRTVFAHPAEEIKVGCWIPLLNQSFAPEKQSPQAVLDMLKEDDTIEFIISRQDGLCLHNEEGRSIDFTCVRKLALALYTVGRLAKKDLTSFFLTEKIISAVDQLQKDHRVPGPCFYGNKVGPNTLNALFSELEALAPLWQEK